MSKKLLTQWDMLSSPIKLCAVIAFFSLLHVGAENWIKLVKKDVHTHKVIGNNTITGQSRAVSVTSKTYYLSSEFEKSSLLADDLDESLFVEIGPAVEAKLNIDAIALDNVKLKKMSPPKTPLAFFVHNALKNNGVENDGGFINGSYYLWNESISTQVVTSNGSFTARLIKADGLNLIVSVNDLLFTLKVNE